MKKEQNVITKIQGMMVGAVAKSFPKLPEWLDSKDTAEGNHRIFVDKRTGKEVDVNLCDMRGFLQAIMFMEG